MIVTKFITRIWLFWSNIWFKTFNATWRRCVHEILFNFYPRFFHYWNYFVDIETIILFKISLLLFWVIPPMNYFPTFIIEDPKNDTSVMLYPTSLLTNLDFWTLNKLVFKKRVKSRAKHHILPYKHSHAISHFIKVIVHVHSSSPDSYNIKISLLCWLKQPFNFSVVFHSVRIIIKRYLICTLKVDFYIINFKIEIFTIYHFILMKLELSNSYFRLFWKKRSRCLLKGYSYIIQILCPKLPRPP